ncbi:hypothetical protein FQN53_006002 [Emmonsiellopsis sp. PD_33]|nr:hypothetical protein FQN53_006002 [Emmonsiellopsis sp. PD_33]
MASLNNGSTDSKPSQEQNSDSSAIHPGTTSETVTQHTESSSQAKWTDKCRPRAVGKKLIKKLGKKAAKKLFEKLKIPEAEQREISEAFKEMIASPKEKNDAQGLTEADFRKTLNEIKETGALFR